jgi:hypothetical protein
MSRYRNRNKGLNLELGNPMTENHGLDIYKRVHPTLLMSTKWLGTQKGYC